MGRNKAPFPSIVHLKILMGLYTRLYNIPAPPVSITEAMFLKALQECLKKDNIVGERSHNVVDKLMGKPSGAQADEGVDVIILEKISQKVLLASKMEIIPDPGSINYYWDAFLNAIHLPSDLHNLPGNYYNSLSSELQEKIDQYVERKIYEIRNDNTKEVYCMYFSNQADRKVVQSVITIDVTQMKAVLKYFDNIDGRLSTKSVQRTDKPTGSWSFSNNNILELNLVEEDDNKSRLRTHLCLSILDSSFSTLEIIKGVFTTAINNATIPVAGMVILKKMKSFSDAYKSIQLPIASEIAFELLGENNIVVPPQKIKDVKDFASARTYKLLTEKIVGGYIFGFLKKPSKGTEIKDVTIGICYIEETGMFTSRIGTSHENTKGHVLNKIFFHDDILRMTNYFTDGADNYKYGFTLKVKSIKGEIELAGVYSGLHNLEPRTGAVIFKKIPKVKNWTDIDKSIAKIASIKNKELHDDNIRSIMDYLLDSKNDFYLLTI